MGRNRGAGVRKPPARIKMEFDAGTIVVLVLTALAVAGIFVLRHISGSQDPKQ